MQGGRHQAPSLLYKGTVKGLTRFVPFHLGTSGFFLKTEARASYMKILLLLHWSVFVNYAVRLEYLPQGP